MRLLVAAAAAVACIDASADQPRKPDMTVFGQALNEPLSIPECPKNAEPPPFSAPGTKPTYKLGELTSACYRTRAPVAPDLENWASAEALDPNGRVWVVFPAAERPSVLGPKAAAVLMRLLDGRVVSAEWDMGGIDRQERVAQALTEKYGRPTKAESRSVQNRMGATFKAVRASWRFPGLQVEFDPVGSTLDDGAVTIRTDAAQRLEDQRREDQKAASRKL